MLMLTLLHYTHKDFLATPTFGVDVANSCVDQYRKLPHFTAQAKNNVRSLYVGFIYFLSFVHSELDGKESDSLIGCSHR